MRKAFVPSPAFAPQAKIRSSLFCQWTAPHWRRASSRSRCAPFTPSLPQLRMTAEAPESPNISTDNFAGLSFGKASVGAALLGFIAITAVGPQNWGDLGALADLAALHFDAVNGVYLGILGLSFVQAAVQVILLSPGFLLSLPGILVGFPILGPYMLLHSPTATPSERQSSDRSATFAGALLALAMLACYGSAFSLGAPAETRDVYFYSSCLNFLRALADDPWLRITTVNAAALALTAAVPLAGDMSRRGWKFSGPQKTEALAALASIAALPGFGPALYLALRPAIQNGEELGE